VRYAIGVPVEVEVREEVLAVVGEFGRECVDRTLDRVAPRDEAKLQQRRDDRIRDG